MTPYIIFMKWLTRMVGGRLNVPYWYLILAVAITASCSGKTDKAEADGNHDSDSVNVSVVLSGSIDETYKIEMNLTVKDELVKGSYFYASRKNSGALNLKGKLDAAGHLTLDEENSDGQPTGHFDGYFNYTDGYSGTFVNYKGKSFPFKLSVKSVSGLPDESDSLPMSETDGLEEISIKEIEALVLYFEINNEKRGPDQAEPIKYADKFQVTLHMNGDVDLHFEMPNIVAEYLRYRIDGTNVYDYSGNWAQRSQKRGTNYVDYYDIEFNNGDRNQNWCVDNECKSVYFTEDAFLRRNSDLESKILKVDTIFVNN
ncbi:MAG: hypothetical protein IJ724_13185 [Muribaculaceae bacterium]|nr:hypothetical protein [Muribaculaceae bacterium]